MDITFEDAPDIQAVICRISGDWDWDFFYETFERFRAEPRAQAAQHLIVDGTGVRRINIDAILNLKRAAGWAAAGSIHFYIVLTNRYIRTIYYLFIRIYPDIAPRFHLVDSLDEARALIKPTP